ncbi:MAG: hypothetical protein JXJ17_00815 [Anaerolineae bacterium]|nr:hypothetical protein [Anaerolineae bacterium]
MMQAQNILQLKEPHLWKCRIVEWSATFTLKIELSKIDETGLQDIYVVMAGVMYHSGPTRWDGADFCIEENNKCVELMQSLPYRSNLTSDYISRRFKLYTVTSDDENAVPIQILAGSGVEVRIKDDIKHLSFYE